MSGNVLVFLENHNDPGTALCLNYYLPYLIEKGYTTLCLEEPSTETVKSYIKALQEGAKKEQAAMRAAGMSPDQCPSPLASRLKLLNHAQEKKIKILHVDDPAITQVYEAWLAKQRGRVDKKTAKEKQKDLAFEMMAQRDAYMAERILKAAETTNVICITGYGHLGLVKLLDQAQKQNMQTGVVLIDNSSRDSQVLLQTKDTLQTDLDRRKTLDDSSPAAKIVDAQIQSVQARLHLLEHGSNDAFHEKYLPGRPNGHKLCYYNQPPSLDQIMRDCFPATLPAQPSPATITGNPNALFPKPSAGDAAAAPEEERAPGLAT
jgi:hypothetical protein